MSIQKDDGIITNQLIENMIRAGFLEHNPTMNILMEIFKKCLQREKYLKNKSKQCLKNLLQKK